jgi:hypothetical protein
MESGDQRYGLAVPVFVSVQPGGLWYWEVASWNIEGGENLRVKYCTVG